MIVSALTTGCLTLLAFLFIANVTRVNVIANKWLGLFYLFLAGLFCQQLLDQSGIPGESSLLIHSLELTRWAVLPCFYVAVLYFVNPGPKKLAVILFHFVPAALFLLMSLIFIIPGLLGYGTSSFRLPPAGIFVVRYFFLIQMIVYWTLSYRQLIIHAKNIREIASSVENIDLSWIRYLMVTMLVMTLVRLASGASEILEQISPWIYFVLVCITGYFSIRQEIIYPVSEAQRLEIESVLNPDKDRERLTSEQVEQLKKKIAHIVDTHKPFLDPSLNLPMLSALVGMGTHELSYVLNKGFDRNFYQFINELRVEEAKSLLLSGKAKQLDMIGIATHAGFNSKTTFNTTFKKLTGQTPTEFLKTKTVPI